MRKVDQEYAVCKISPPMDSFLHGNHKTWPRIVRSTVFDTTATIHTFLLSLVYIILTNPDVILTPVFPQDDITDILKMSTLKHFDRMKEPLYIFWDFMELFKTIFPNFFFLNNFHLQFQKKDCNENGIGSFVLDL